jgi:glucan phosphoethanolaminetransferase (alkaline phosphatase superfamily)
MLVLHLIFFIVNLKILDIKKIKIKKMLLTVTNFSFLFSLILFYILIIGSNIFWGRAITLELFFIYLVSFGKFVKILPVSIQIIYVSILSLLICIIIAYHFIQPKVTSMANQKVKNIFLRFSRKSILITASFLLLIFFISFNKIVSFKRNAHFVGEPILEFFYGPMWNSETMEHVYNEKMIKNKLADEECIKNITIEKSENGKLIIVLLLDGLRADYLSAYGYKQKTTPFIDSLLTTNHFFKVSNTFSTSTTTLVGLASILCSKEWEKFSFTGLNIMKFLKRKGYKTYAFLTGYHRNWYGLSTIYKNDCDFFYESTENSIEQNFDDFRTLKKFQNTNLKQKSLVYIHLLSTHVVGEKKDEFRKFLPDKIGFNSSKREVLVNNYNNGIIQADEIIKGVFTKLKSSNLLEKSIVYILSDHGEMFGEDGRWSHSGSIHQDLLRVPLFIYDSDTAAYKNKMDATLLDIPPTIVSRLGYEIPVCWQGNSLTKPFSNYTINLNAGSPCDVPTGTLKRDSTGYTLKLIRKNGQLEKVLRTQADSINWR